MVTDVYNSGKGYAFVTFENAEDGQNAIKVSSARSSGISCMLVLDYFSISILI